MTEQPEPPAPDRFLAGLAGLLAAGVTLGVGELVAALLRPASAPIIAVGNRLIVLTPEPVKRWAIHRFGTGDKAALLTGSYLVLAVCAIGIGILAVRRLVLGLAGVGLLGLLGAYCALTANASRPSDAVPSVLGALAGAMALRRLVSALQPVDEAVPLPAAGPVPGRRTGSVLRSRRTGAVLQRHPDGQLLPPRRRFLAGSLAAGALAVIGGGLGRLLQHARFDAEAARSRVVLPAPSAGARPATAGYDLGRSGQPFQTPAADFYRIDTALAVPQVNPETWTLRITGMVARELTLTYQQLLARPLVERWVTLACVSNEVGGDLIGNARFRGVLLAPLLREAGIDPAADQLVATSVDGMTIGSPTAVVLDGRDAMLAVGMNGEPLPVRHGFPVRMVVPGLYGYVSACKWISTLRATTFAADQAYWVQGGWAARGPIRLASRIDRPTASGVVRVGAETAVAGVAWDQHVGVSRVEVQVDDEPWQPAVLAPVPSTDTWRQWVWLWTPRTAGVHRLRVRAYDARGNPQDTRVADPFPAGATGLHGISVRAR